MVIFLEREKKTIRASFLFFCCTPTSHGIALVYYVQLKVHLPLCKGSTVMSWIFLKDRSLRSREFTTRADDSHATPVNCMRIQ